MKFINNKNYHKEIENLFSKEENLDIAVAFFGKDAIKLFNDAKNKKIRVVCNLESGACNPFLIENILKISNVHVKTNHRLHAKTLIVNDTVIIGSANISSNGLSLEGNESSGWIETGVLTSSINIVSESKIWFDHVWNDSLKVVHNDLEKYKKTWNERRNNRPIIITENSIFDAAKKHIDTFQDRKIYFAIYRDENPSSEAIETYNNVKDIHSKLSQKIDFFEDWSDLPEDAHLISIYVGPKYGARVDGIYKTHSNRLIEKFEKANGETG